MNKGSTKEFTQFKKERKKKEERNVILPKKILYLTNPNDIITSMQLHFFSSISILIINVRIVGLVVATLVLISMK
jgi:hypothetical protein